jgi:hypothetical protein
VKKPGDVERFYTSETIRNAGKYRSKNGADILMGYDRKIFDKGSVIETVSEKITGTSADVRIRIIKHPQPNMIGIYVNIKMKYENGRWKIDRSKEIGELL